MEKHELLLLAIVAIVAIVAIAVLVISANAAPAFGSSANLAGNAKAYYANQDTPPLSQTGQSSSFMPCKQYTTDSWGTQYCTLR